MLLWSDGTVTELLPPITSYSSQLADCWAAGLYCKEWYPMQVAADKFCALANTTSMDGLDLPSQTTTLPPSSTAIAGIGIGGAGIAGESRPFF